MLHIQLMKIFSLETLRLCRTMSTLNLLDFIFADRIKLLKAYKNYKILYAYEFL